MANRPDGYWRVALVCWVDEDGGVPEWRATLDEEGEHLGEVYSPLEAIPVYTSEQQI